MARSGGKNSKKRAVVAVARKLSVLLHRLWVSAEAYDPLYNAIGVESWRLRERRDGVVGKLERRWRSRQHRAATLK
jgi:hypothetical protein